MMNLTIDCSDKDAAVIDCFVNATLKVRNPVCRKPLSEGIAVRWGQEAHKYEYDIDGYLRSLRTQLATM